jgi:hypothetical protein
VSINKAYIGDSVYADFDGQRLILTTENGMGPSNRIVLEPEVCSALWTYVRHLKLQLERTADAWPKT